MSNETTERFDPRFDPAFQRGFDPAAPVARSNPAPVARPQHNLDQPIESPSAPLTRAAAAPVIEQSLSEPLDTVHTTLVEVAQPEVLDAPNLRRNPYLFVLGIIAVLLIVAGVWLFVQSGNAFDGREVLSQGDYMSLVAGIQVAPFISILGGATAIGVLFMVAGRWRRKG